MSRGPRSAAPDLPGFSAERWIGGGGFADVFLYTQHRPSRSVAVKILRSEHLTAQALEQFDIEADIMAEISTHPYIVTIFSSGVSSDGRPYIVMEHYPQPNFGERAKGGKMDVTEVLRTGVQVASAVETAHRAAIIHRDIKPANILTSAFGRPGLTDFGISGVQSESGVSEAHGITPAYTAPELISEESAGSVATDVYGLAATVFALAAGHSPVWSPHGDNGEQAALARAMSGQLTPLTRPDLPETLGHLLSQAMSMDASHRPQSAYAFAQALQQIEQQLRLQPTQIEVAQTERDISQPKDRGADESDTEKTRLGIQVVNPHAPTTSPIPQPATPPNPLILASSTPAPAPVKPQGRIDTPHPPLRPGTPTPAAVPLAPPPGYRPPTPSAFTQPDPTTTSTPVEADTIARPRNTSSEFAPTATSFGSSIAGTFYEPAPIPSPATHGWPGHPETPTPNVQPAKRLSIPWKWVGTGAGLLAALLAVVLITSRGERDARIEPGGSGAINQEPVQNMDAIVNTAAITPTDISIHQFLYSSPDQTVATANLTWTPVATAGTELKLRIASIDGTGELLTTTVPAEDNNGEILITLSLAEGTCTNVSVGDNSLGPLPCSGSPPCIEATAVRINSASGNPILVPPASANETAIADQGNAMILPDDYQKRCASTFNNTN